MASEPEPITSTGLQPCHAQMALERILDVFDMRGEVTEEVGRQALLDAAALMRVISAALGLVAAELSTPQWAEGEERPLTPREQVQLTAAHLATAEGYWGVPNQEFWPGGILESYAGQAEEYVGMTAEDLVQRWREELELEAT